MELVEGKIVWTCQPPIENGYDERLLPPYQVKLRLGVLNVWYGSGFNLDTGEIDKDMNATIFAKEFNCFETRKEANDYYEGYLVMEVNLLQEELEHFQTTRED